MVYLVTILVYLVALLCIGIYKSRQVKTQADFSVAGRTLSPWVLVCTMLAVWIGTGSIVGNAGKAYETGLAALILPLGSVIGMILLTQVAGKARNYEVYSVPEIIGTRYGRTARLLAVVALIIAYMVIVSYQFNAGGMVLEVIAGKQEPVVVEPGDSLTRFQADKAYITFNAEEGWTGTAEIEYSLAADGGWSDDTKTFFIEVVEPENFETAVEKIKTDKSTDRVAVEAGQPAVIIFEHYEKDTAAKTKVLRVDAVDASGILTMAEPKLTAHTATIIAAAFIITYTILAGLMSLAYADIVTGVIITFTLICAFPVLWFKAGGWSGMEASFAAMGDRPQHMQFWGVYSKIQIINYCLPVFLLIMGDANQYQRFFASRNAKGAKTAVTIMIFGVLIIESLIILEAWICSSLIPHAEHGKYVLIYAAKEFMPVVLGLLFMVTVVGIIISTADSFLLVPSTCFIRDVYMTYINRKASEKRVVFLSRVMVLIFGVTAWLVSLAFAESTTVFRKALYAFTIYGSAITPCLVAALFWKGATGAGAIVSILLGTAVTLVWEEIETLVDWLGKIMPGAAANLKEFGAGLPSWVSELDAVLPAIGASVLGLIVVSLLTKKKQSIQGD